jgi:choline dehydrogenase-like flavoprotein
MGPAHDGSSVVDENGRVWAYENLYVAGAAVLAQANAGNPTIACIAAALRTVDAIAGHV